MEDTAESATTQPSPARRSRIGARYQLLSSEYARAAEGSEEHRNGWMIRIPGPPELSVERVWHYTDCRGLLGIVESNRVWATSAQMLNDKSEINYGIKHFAQALNWVARNMSLDERQKRFLQNVHARVLEVVAENEIYVVCASRNGDDLGQWRGYAGGSGYAVALDPFVALAATAPKAELLGQLTNEPRVEWLEVVYNVKRQKKLLRDVGRFITASTPSFDAGAHWDSRVAETVATALGTVARIKHPGFASEKEVRLVIIGERVRPTVKYRPSSLGPTAYIPMAAVPESKDGQIVVAIKDSETLSLPILDIAVGPAQDQGTAESGVRSLLRGVGRTDVKVTKAKIPYR